MHRSGPEGSPTQDKPEAGELLVLGEVRPYTNEELATAHQAAKDFVDSLGEAGHLVTARDLAMFDAGFKRGRRTPPPAMGQARLEAARQCARNWAGNRTARDTIVNAFLAGCHWMDTVQLQAKSARRGFTLIELLVVMLIIGLVAVGVLPMFVSAIQERGVVSAAQLVQASIVSARDAAGAAGVRRGGETTQTVDESETLQGIRLIPSKPPTRLPDGTVDMSVALTSNAFVPISIPPGYTDGKVSIYPSWSYPQSVTGGRPCLVLEESPGEWVATENGYVWLPNAPVSWAWNLRVGEKASIGDRHTYTICGPMLILPGDGNPEQHVNYGPPGAPLGFSRTYTSPDGQSIDVTPEYLLLANQRDDDHDGATDDGWDGIDNDADGLIDELDEWEIETWFESQARGAASSSYRISRRAIPTLGKPQIELPKSTVIDLTGNRSRTVVDPYSGCVNLLVNRLGHFSYDSPYGGTSYLGMDRTAFVHLWIGSAADVIEPADPMPMPKEDARLITVSRVGRISVLTVDPDAALPQPGDLPEIILETRRGER